MKVMKFGGRSLGSPEKMKQVLDIIAAGSEPVVVVLSALGGTSQNLREVAESLQNNRISSTKKIIKKIETYYRDFINGVLQNNELKSKALANMDEHFGFLQFLTRLSYSDALCKDILSQGELMSTLLLSACLSEAGLDHKVLPALDFMQADKLGEPLIGNIKVKLTQLMKAHPDTKLFITQGSLCRNARGEVDNLNIGGSDYTASAIAAAMGASICEIWTDIPTIHNNDSTIVHDTKPVENLTFDEAAELAYFGEKVLHPASVWPARHYNIPVRLLNTQQPAGMGTLIQNLAETTGPKVIAARDKITVVNIKSSRMLMAFGFLEKIVSVFEQFHTSIDMVTTSEIAVSVTIDNTEHIEDIAKQLENYGVVTVEENQTLITIVGNQLLKSPKVMMQIFDAVGDIPLKMSSYGASLHNLSLLIPDVSKEEALTKLHKALF